MARILEALETLPIIERLRKSRGRWRLIAFLALIALAITMTLRIAGDLGANTEPYVARIVVEGTITTDPLRLRIIRDLEEDEQVSAVIVRINSPGGTTAGGEELYDALRKLAETKPVVATINELGASAAYMTAIGTDRIFARRLSIVGSIGVFVQHVDAGGLLRTIGIDFDKVQSGPLKAEPDIDDPLAGPARQSLQALVDDSFAWFVDIVAERRNLDRATALGLADGRIVTGRVALDLGLIDALGGERDAMEWLAETHEIDPEQAILTRFPLPESDFERWMRLAGGQMRSAIGLGEGSALLPLDGLVSLWHVGQ